MGPQPNSFFSLLQLQYCIAHCLKSGLQYPFSACLVECSHGISIGPPVRSCTPGHTRNPCGSGRANLMSSGLLGAISGVETGLWWAGWHFEVRWSLLKSSQHPLFSLGGFLSLPTNQIELHNDQWFLLLAGAVEAWNINHQSVIPQAQADVERIIIAYVTKKSAAKAIAARKKKPVEEAAACCWWNILGYIGYTTIWVRWKIWDTHYLY